MSYEINILSLGQDALSDISILDRIELCNEIEHENIRRYQLTWPYLSNAKGIWYSLGITEDGWFNAMSIIDIDFDEKLSIQHLPYWVKDDEILENIKCINLYDDYKTEFYNIIKELTQKSPYKKIMFLCRFQGGDEELIYGVVNIDNFIEMLDNRKVYSNICYIVKGN